MTHGWLRLALLALSLLAPAQGVCAPPDQVTIAIYRYGAPFTLVDPLGEPAGLVVQMWRLWSEATGVAVRFLPTSWADSLEAVEDGRADIHSGLFRTDERAAWMAFSEAIHEVETAVYVKVDSGVSADDLGTLGGRPVGTIGGSQQLAWLAEHYPELDAVAFPNTYSAFVALLAGDLDAVVDEAPAAAAAIARLGLPGSFTRSAAPLYTETLRAGVRAGRHELLHLINEGFRSLPRDRLAALEALWLPNPEDRFYVGGSGTITLTDAEKTWLEAHPVIRLASTSDYPPYSFLDDNGFLTGFETDLVALLNRKLGTQIVPEVYDRWNAALEAALRWETDGILALSITPERAERMLFTGPYAYEPAILLGRPDGPSFESWEALAGHTISIEEGAFWTDELRDLVGQGGRLIETEDEASGLALLRAGETDGHVTWRNIFEDLRRDGGADDLVVRLTRNVEGGAMRIAVAKDRRPLLGILRKGLNAITLAEWSRMRERWLTPARTEHRRSVELTPREERWLAEHPQATVANEQDWPPFDFAEDGEPRGFAIDILRLAAHRIGLGLDFVNGYTWAELMAMFRSGALDILPAVYQTPERRDFIAFTRSYATNPSVLVTQAGRTDILTPEDLQGRRVASVAAFATAQVMAERWPAIEQVQVTNVLEGLKAVSLGQVDAFVGSLGVISYVLEDTYIPNLQVVNEVTIKHPDETRLHMGVALEREILRDLLQKGLDAISAEEMSALRRRWLPISEGLAQTGAALGVKLSREQRQWLADHRSLRVGDDFAVPPFSFLDDSGRFAGISASYLDLAAKRLKLTLTPEAVADQEAALQRLRAGAVDLVPGIVASVADEPAAGMLLTAPYVSFPVVIATQREARFVADLADLAGRRIGLGTRHLDPMRWQTRHPDLSFVRMADAAEGVAALAEGAIDAYIDDLGSITYAIERAGETDIKIAAPTDESVALSVAVRGDWPELVGILEAAFDSFTDDERRAIKNTWLAVTYTVGLDLRTVLRWAVPSALSGLAILLVILIWNRRLGAEIGERKAAQARLFDAHEQIQASINYASHIQRSLLPLDGPDTSVLPFKEHFLVWEPRDLVGGDMLWTRPWGEGTLLILADCTGHGVPGAFMTLIATGALDRARLEVPPGDLAALVQRVHQLVKLTLRAHRNGSLSDDGLELGACYVRFDAPIPQLSFSGARFSLFTVQGETVHEIKGSRRALGYRSIPFEQAYPAETVPVEPDMTFYLTTDGIIDQVGGPKRRAFGRRRFIALLSQLAGVPVHAQGAHIMAALLTHQQSERRRDDVSVIGFRLA